MRQTLRTTLPLRIMLKLYMLLVQSQGQIDDVKTWNYALNATQVKNEYTSAAVRFGP